MPAPAMISHWAFVQSASPVTTCQDRFRFQRPTVLEKLISRDIILDMAQLLVRDVPDEVAAELKKRAKKNGRSAEAEHRALLLETYTPKKTDPWAEIDRLRTELEKSGRKFSDSTQLIREDRDSR